MTSPLDSVTAPVRLLKLDTPEKLGAAHVPSLRRNVEVLPDGAEIATFLQFHKSFMRSTSFLNMVRKHPELGRDLVIADLKVARLWRMKDDDDER